MADLDWSKHDKAVTDFVRGVTDYYLRTEASTGERLKEGQGILLRNNYATPARMVPLINTITVVTMQVKDKLDAVKVACLAAQMDLEQCKAGSATYGPMLNDYEDWIVRLAEYKAETGAALDRNPDASGDEDPVFWANVTKPLLLGLYPGLDYQTKLDAVTPITLAWQIEVAKAAYDNALSQLWKDLKASAGDVIDTTINFGTGLVLLAVAGLALGYGYGRGR